MAVWSAPATAVSAKITYAPGKQDVSTGVLVRITSIASPIPVRSEVVTTGVKGPVVFAPSMRAIGARCVRVYPLTLANFASATPVPKMDVPERVWLKKVCVVDTPARGTCQSASNRAGSGAVTARITHVERWVVDFLECPTDPTALTIPVRHPSPVQDKQKSEVIIVLSIIKNIYH